MEFRQNDIKNVGLCCEVDMGPASQMGRTKRRLEVSLASNNNMFSYRSESNENSFREKRSIEYALFT